MSHADGIGIDGNRIGMVLVACRAGSTMVENGKHDIDVLTENRQPMWATGPRCQPSGTR